MGHSTRSARAGSRLGEAARSVSRISSIAAAGLVAPAANALLGLVLVRYLDSGSLGVWGLSTALTQFLPLFALGGPMWLYARSGVHEATDAPRLRDGRVLSVVLLTLPLVVAVYAAVARVSGMSGAGSVSFGIGCGLLQLTGYQVMRLKVDGRLVAANTMVGVDRAAMALLFPALAAVVAATPALLGHTWLIAQVVAVVVCIRILPLPRPRKPHSIFEFRAGLYVAIALAAVNSILSLARLPIARLGTEVVGTFVAAGYLVLPVLAVGAAIDQLAFFRLARLRRQSGDRSEDEWSRFATTMVVFTACAAIVARLVGPPVLAALNSDYRGAADFAGPILGWSVSMSLIGLSLKQVVSDDRVNASLKIAGVSSAVMLLALAVPIAGGLDVRPSLQVFAASSFLVGLWVVRHAGSMGRTPKGGPLVWMLVVLGLSLW